MKVADITYKDNVLSLTGELDFYNVVSVYEKSRHFLQTPDAVIFDFSGLKESNSVAIALIIEWIKFANANKKKISIQHLSPELINIAKAGGLDTLLSHFVS